MKNNYGVYIIQNIMNNLIVGEKEVEGDRNFESNDEENENFIKSDLKQKQEYYKHNFENKFNSYYEKHNDIENGYECDNENENEETKETSKVNKKDELNLLKKQNFCFINSSHAYIFPITYFIISITSIFILILLHCIKDNLGLSKDRHAQYPFPGFYTLNQAEPILYHLSTIMISLIGLLNVWFYCSMLLQRFAVPELQSKKIWIHLMFILGILSNTTFVFFGFSHNIYAIEKIVIKDIKISLGTLIFLTFQFLNILFGLLSIFCLDALFKETGGYFNCKKKKKEKVDLKNKIKNKIVIKKSILYLSVFVMLLYIGGIALKDQNQENSSYCEIILNFILFILPYVIFIVNAFLNLSYYSDILFIQDNLMTIIDKEFFESGYDENFYNK